MAELRMARVGEALWPEGAGVLTVCGAEVIAAALDTTIGWKQPVLQYLVTGGSIVGGGIATGYGVAHDYSKGVLYGGLVLVAANVCRTIYDAVVGKAVSVKQVFALIPETTRGAGKPKGGGETLEKRLVSLEAAVRRLAEAQGGAISLELEKKPETREMVPVR